jgi:hypothetical protein
MKVQDEWYEQARGQTLQTLPTFVEHLAIDYGHDYGTICHALAAAAIAAASALNHSEAGGITGFQAGAMMWQFISKWMRYDSPLKMLNYDDMLYPQYRDRFDQSISTETWKWIQEQAKTRLAEDCDRPHAHPDVRRHWKSIVEGVVPFGWHVAEEGNQQ